MQINSVNLRTRSDNASITVEFNYKEIFVKFNVLFNIIKYGFIRPETVKQYADILNNTEVNELSIEGKEWKDHE